METKGIRPNNTNANLLDGIASPLTEKSSDVIPVDVQQKLKKARENQLKSQAANVNVSDRARDIAQARAKALDIARNTPDVREDRVAELRKKIQAGQYNVDSEKIADGILAEAIRDEVAKEMHEEAKNRNR